MGQYDANGNPAGPRSTVYTDPQDLTRVGDRAAHRRGFIDGFAGNAANHTWQIRGYPTGVAGALGPQSEWPFIFRVFCGPRTLLPLFAPTRANPPNTTKPV